MMRKILDKMFENRKLSILIPILVSVLLYLLFIIFGVAEDKMNIIIATPIVCEMVKSNATVMMASHRVQQVCRCLMLLLKIKSAML